NVDDKTLKGIIKALYYPQSPYEFTMVSADILGSVYERFLGKVITLTAGHNARIEEKPEVRKAGGVYYTPTYIVDYIVKNTIGKLLENKTPKDAAKTKVLDPACGSGSFLIGAYQFLLDWYHSQYTTAPADPAALATGKKPVLRPGLRGGWSLTIAERKRILLDHIHGVDLDDQAVEVTKLNLLLKCLEGETSQTLGFEQRLFRERALPDLGKNILCGNSLIGADIIGTEAWNAMSEEEQRKINPFDYERAFPAVFKQSGFDAVIGNPPYINMLTLDKLQPKPIKAYWSDSFSVAAGAYDIYILFFERGHDVLRQGGLLSFIVPNKFLAAEYAVRFREWIAETWQFRSIVDFSRVKVWKKASVYPVVPGFQKDRPQSASVLTVLQATGESASNLSSLADVPFAHLDTMPDRLWSFVTRDGASMLLRLISKSTPLAQVAQVWGASTVAEGDTYPGLLVVGKRPAEPHARFVVSGTVQRYHSTWLVDAVQFTKKSYQQPYIKLVHPMTERRQQQAGSPKIVICKVALRPRALLDLDGEYVGAYTTYVLNSTLPLQYVTAIINSRLMSWAYELLYDALAMSGGYLRFQPPQIRRLPIRVDDSERGLKLRGRIVSLVDTMLSLHKRLATEQLPQRQEQIQREIDATDRQIDQLVYQLYGLTDDEIRIVEEATR
ncbi:MAG TPA: N-6 DNA methylase, partial [Tepidisphaeraceae bacterium]